MFVITKDFTWAMGHRVHNQELNSQLSCGSYCKCRKLHGHSYVATVSLEAETLEKNMVMDFTDLKFIKNWIDNHLDHCFMIDEADPMAPALLQGLDAYLKESTFGIKVIDSVIVESSTNTEDERDILRSYVVVDYVPTSEEIARHIFDFVSREVPAGVNVKSVTIKESPTSSATYGESDA